MSIVLRHVNLSPAGGDDTDQADPATAAEMMMDLFSASGIPSERIAANVVIAQPPNMGNAIHHFYLLGTLLKGYLSEGRPQHLECAVLLSCSKQNTSEGDVYRLGSQVQKPTLDRRETPALFLTEELFVEASNEPGLRFSRVSASGSGGTLYELSHSDGGADSASGMEPKGLAQQAAIQPSETFREERRSIDDLPESLLLAVDRRPGAWAAALGCTLLAILMFAVGVTHPFHHASKPSSTFPEAREVRPVEAPLVAPPVRPDTNVLVPTRVAPPYQAKPRASVQDKETSMHDSDQVVEKGKSHPEIAYTRAELETLLGKADRLSGNGQYEAAIRAYKIVLRNDARNGAAIQGLRRAELNRDQ